MSSNFKAREKLYKAKKKPEESIRKWISRLEYLADESGLDQQRQTLILRDIFVIGLNGPIKNKLYKEIDKNSRISLSKLQELALQDEYVKKAKTKKKPALDFKGLLYDEERNEVNIQYRCPGEVKPVLVYKSAGKPVAAQMGRQQCGYIPIHQMSSYPY